MEQIKSIVQEIYTGLTARPDRIAEIVTRQTREYIVFDYAKKSSMILAIEDGRPEDQYDYSTLPNSHQRYVTILNQQGKLVVGMLIASKETQGARLQQVWSSLPTVSVVLFALGLRIWGSYLDVSPAFASTVSTLKKYFEVNGSTTQDDLNVYVCRPEAAILPYQDDVTTIDENYAGLYEALVKEANDMYLAGNQSVLNGVKIWYDIFPGGSPLGGGDFQAALRRLKHPAVYLIDSREETLRNLGKLPEKS